jgi:hypothetical protein
VLAEQHLELQFYLSTLLDLHRAKLSKVPTFEPFALLLLHGIPAAHVGAVSQLCLLNGTFLDFDALPV